MVIYPWGVNRKMLRLGDVRSGTIAEEGARGCGEIYSILLLQDVFGHNLKA